MGRRRQTDEIAFGSDSFLDIVANIVGILIILIVIAGVRVAQMPAISKQIAQAEAAPVAEAAPLLSIAAPATSAPAIRPVPPPPPQPISAPQPIEPSPQLLGRLASLRSELARLEQSRESLTLELNERKQQGQIVRQQVTAAESDRQRELLQIENGRRTITTLQTDLETCQRQIAGLQLELAELETVRPPEKQLRHKLTPLGKVVEGPELHFLLSNNGLAVVPVDELGLKLKEELLRKKSQLLRGRTRVGTVGPVEGFTMEYVVAREALSLRDELQMGAAVVRIAVSEWRIEPQRDAVFEPAGEVLLPRSRFLEALRASGPGATLTFWVYPDSFALHRQLQEFAHDNGFDVAARPLPFGIPIIGSNTNGSRSIAQ